MSHLLDIIDAYKDSHGQPSDASVARMLGLAPQTVSSWRRRGIKDMPNRRALRELARITNRDFESDVLRAALMDAGYVDDGEPEVDLGKAAEAEVQSQVRRRKRRKSPPEASEVKGTDTATG